MESDRPLPVLLALKYDADHNSCDGDLMMEERKRPVTTRGRELSLLVADELATQALRIKPWVSADRLWTRVLTEEDRQRLGGNLEESYPRLGTAGMWMELHGVSAERAVIEVARELGFLNEQTANWLLKAVGEEVPVPFSPDRPSWHAESGLLRLGPNVVRQVRVMAEPSNVQRILDAFQAAGWPARIEDPLPNAPDQQRLHQAVFSLNEGLDGLRFKKAVRQLLGNNAEVQVNSKSTPLDATRCPLRKCRGRLVAGIADDCRSLR